MKKALIILLVLLVLPSVLAITVKNDFLELQLGDNYETVKLYDGVSPEIPIKFCNLQSGDDIILSVKVTSSDVDLRSTFYENKPVYYVENEVEVLDHFDKEEVNKEIISDDKSLESDEEHNLTSEIRYNDCKTFYYRFTAKESIGKYNILISDGKNELLLDPFWSNTQAAYNLSSFITIYHNNSLMYTNNWEKKTPNTELDNDAVDDWVAWGSDGGDWSRYINYSDQNGAENIVIKLLPNTTNNKNFGVYLKSLNRTYDNFTYVIKFKDTESYASDNNLNFALADAMSGTKKGYWCRTLRPAGKNLQCYTYNGSTAQLATSFYTSQTLDDKWVTFWITVKGTQFCAYASFNNGITVDNSSCADITNWKTGNNIMPIFQKLSRSYTDEPSYFDIVSITENYNVSKQIGIKNLNGFYASYLNANQTNAEANATFEWFVDGVSTYKKTVKTPNGTSTDYLLHSFLGMGNVSDNDQNHEVYVNIQSCDSGRCTTAKSYVLTTYEYVTNYTLTEVYPSKQYEGEYSGGFSLNISHGANIYLVNITQFFYNGSSRPLTIINGTGWTYANSSGTAPLVLTNNTALSFYWNYTLYYVNTTVFTNQTDNTNNVFWSYFVQSTGIPTHTVEGEKFNITMNITKLYSIGTISNPKIEYDGVNHTPTSLGSGSGWQAYYWEGQSQEASGYWNDTFTVKRFFTITNTSSIDRVKSGSHVVYNYRVGICGGNETTPAFNFTFLKEEDDLNISASYAALFKVYNDVVTDYYGFSGVNAVAFCISPGFEAGMTADYEIQYWASGYSRREWQEQAITVSNVSVERNLYLILEGSHRNVTFHVTDVNEQPLSNYIVECYRFNVTTNDYRLVQAVKTNDDGEAIGYLFVANTTYYQFKVKKNNVLRYQSSRMLIIGSDIYFRLDLEPYTDLQDIFNIRRLSHTITNSSDIIWLWYNDSNNYTSSVCLKVEMYNGTNVTLTNTQCSSAGSDNLTFDTTGIPLLYIATAYAVLESTGNTLAFDVFHFDLRTDLTDIYGRDGLIFVAILVIVMGLVGSWNPSVAVGLGLFAVVGVSMLGVISISWPVLIGVIVVGLMIIYLLRT